jgi:lipopolysaccharide export system permease protein
LKKLLYKYIFMEIVTVFAVCLAVFIFIALARQMIIITEWIFQYNVNLRNIFFIVVCLLPEIILYSLPAATLVSVILAFTRLSVDNEIIAMKASGISIFQLLPPVLFLSLTASFMALAISVYAGPLGKQNFRDTTIDILKSNTTIGLKERIFSQPMKDLVFFINNISYDRKSMNDIFIMDNRSDKTIINTIVAKKGRLNFQEGSSYIIFSLEDGNIFINDYDLSAVRSIRFNTYDFRLDLEDMVPATIKKEVEPEEMSLSELAEMRKTIPPAGEHYNEIVLELMERFTLPLAVLLMGFIGAPLGSQVKGRGRLAGGVIGLGVFLLYYLCWAGFRSLSEAGLVPPEVGAWGPVVILLAFGAHLFRSAAADKPLLDRQRAAWGVFRLDGLRGVFGGRHFGPHDPNTKTRSNHFEEPVRRHEGDAVPQSRLPVPLELVPGRLEPPAGGRYVANRRTGKFHVSTCRWAMKINPKDRFHFFSPEDAEGAGYVACKICRP